MEKKIRRPNKEQREKFELADHFEKETSNRPNKTKIKVVLSLSALLVSVFFLLPLFLEKPENKSIDERFTKEKSAENGKTLNAVEKSLEIDRKRAQDALRRTLASIEDLQNMSTDLWAKSEWSEIKNRIDEGQFNYRTKHYSSALENFNTAETKAVKLLDKIPALVENFMTEGNLALQAQDSNGASEAFKMVLNIRPNHPHAQRGLERTSNIDKVFSLIEQGHSFKEMNALDKARMAFQEALRLDPESTAALSAIQGLELPEKEKKYNKLMSDGFRKLDSNKFATAIKSFTSAYKVFGNRQAPLRAIDEVNNTKTNYRIENYEKKALQAKTKENWQAAYLNFSNILEIDPSLPRARKEQKKAASRILLEKQMIELIDASHNLLDDKVYNLAKNILLAAKKEAPRGPKISAHIQKLEKVILLSRKSITVFLRSDAVTAVNLTLKGELGMFLEQSLELNPGEYTLTGSKDGFRKTQKTFRVQHGEPLEAIEIICNERVLD